VKNTFFERGTGRGLHSVSEVRSGIRIIVRTRETDRRERVDVAKSVGEPASMAMWGRQAVIMRRAVFVTRSRR